MRRETTFRRGAAILGCGILFASPAVGQEIRTSFVPFRTAGDQNGYLSASVAMKYRFIACAGEVHVAYSLDPATVRTSRTYQLDGQSFETAEPPPKPSAIEFSGRAMDGWLAVGDRFSDGNAGPALGFGCFTGQSQKVGLVKDLIGPAATPAQVDAYLAKLTVDPNPTSRPLTSAAVESKHKAEALKAKRAEEAKLRKELAAKAAAEGKRKQERAKAERELAGAKDAEERARDDRETAERKLAQADLDGAQADETDADTPDVAQDGASEPAPAEVPAAKRAEAERVAKPTAPAAPPAAEVKTWHAYCLFEDTLGGRANRRGSSPEDDGAPAYITGLFTIGLSNPAEGFQRVGAAFDAHVRQTISVSAEARHGGCSFKETAEEAAREHATVVRYHPQGGRHIGGDLFSKIAKYRLSQIDWSPPEVARTAAAEPARAPKRAAELEQAPTPGTSERADAGAASADAPEAAGSPSQVSASTLNASALATLQEIQARDDAAAAKYAAEMKAFRERVAAEQAAHAAEVARIEQANTDARRRHEAAVAETKRRTEQAQAEWRSRVEACKKGDRSQCASQ